MSDDKNSPEDSSVDSDFARITGSGDFEATLIGFPQRLDQDGRRARLPIEILASQFIDSHRKGEEPSIEKYAKKYRRLADEIRELFPAILAMEQLKSEEEATALRDQVRGEFNIRELGGCRIIGELGRGGMGVVFQAIEQRTRRRLAIKLLPWPSEAVPRWRERFQEEARLSARLQHRNIVPIYSFGEDDGYCFLLMRFIEGVSLDRVIEELDNSGTATIDHMLAKDNAVDVDALPPLDRKALKFRSHSWKKFARIGQQTANALFHAHQAGTLHNDIKPGNLLIDRLGKTWVTDFGLAQALGSDDQRVTGTLRYMPPERFQGTTNERTDIYSLGATLYELLTLQPMFDAETNTALIEKITTRRPLRPCDIESTIPRNLEAVVQRAIQPNPKDRYQSAKEMSQDLAQFI